MKTFWCKKLIFFYRFRFSIVFVFLSLINFHTSAQPEVMAWGNITGISVDGQLMEFETSLRVVDKGWSNIVSTGMEKQQPKYDRNGILQIVNTSIKGFHFIETVEEKGKDNASVNLKVTADSDTAIGGIYFCIDLPDKIYSEAVASFSGGKSKLKFNEISSKNNKNPFKIKARGLVIESKLQQFEISFNSVSNIYIRKEAENYGTQIYIEMLGQKINKGQSVQKDFQIKSSGIIDHSPVELVLDTKHPGRKFDGFGGNFRLQNPKADPKVIQYCLDNMRVAWGRVEMPWQLWHPDENVNPLETAQAGNLNPHVKASMEMARKLTEIGMPIIISDWAAPNWAIIGDPADAYRFRSKGIFGYPLNPEKLDKIYQSICDYLIYLKQNYGVEPALFSFNESDLGINVRHTGQEHADFIKGLGAKLASCGLATKLLLGDNSDATTFDFIVPAMNDPLAQKYIGAISFHSWRGCTDETLKKWANASQKLNMPLIVGEGSTDAAAWSYPAIFSESTFALYEINLYTRLCAICQPLSILQWQLTSDYSVLTGDGIYGTNGPLVPTQRFWNLKQISATPVGAFSIPVKANKEGINCAAFGNIAKSEYVVHIVNNGAECKAIVKGIPDGISSFEIYVTDNKKEMQKTGEVKVDNGGVELMLSAAGFTSLFSKR